jgi:radical SAM superfamily enzyme YgiQ (UPF0313 family)
MRIILAYKSHPGGASDPYTSLLPIGLGYINAFLREKGFSSLVANLSGMGWKRVENLLEKERPAVLGISQFTHNRDESLKLAACAKKLNPRCFIALGGSHATHRAAEMLAATHHIDAVVLGEGEETFAELVEFLSAGKSSLDGIAGLAIRSANGIMYTQPRQRIRELDSLPFPARYFDDAVGVNLQSQMEFIVTSRGCPAACHFCSSPKFWGKALVFRSPGSIVDEIRFIRDNYGIIYFSIRDDTFTIDRIRVLEFCRTLLKEKVYILWNCQSRVNAVDEEMLGWMKRAGCECIQFGIESGSTRILRRLGKGISPDQVRKAALLTRKAGINLSVYLISGVPGETREDLEETKRLIDEIKANDGQVSPLAYYPGTSLFEGAVAAGEVPRDLFERQRDEAFYARNDPFVAEATAALLERMHSVAIRNGYKSRDFRLHKKELGYCHATNAMAGNYFEGEGRWRAAEGEYQEIIEREPDNPWGWLLLGDLYGQTGLTGKARECYGKLAKLIPNHPQAAGKGAGKR